VANFIYLVWLKAKAKVSGHILPLPKKNTMRVLPTILTVVLFLSLLACQQQQPAALQQANQPGATSAAQEDTILVTMQPNEFYKKITDNRNLPIIDIRTPAEFNAGHIWRAFNMPYNDPAFESRLGAMGRSNEYAIYCAAGTQSKKVAEEMKSLGFKRIYYLKDGLIRWGETGQALQIK
jgi:rhodanese-related sulfurtransferase